MSSGDWKKEACPDAAKEGITLVATAIPYKIPQISYDTAVAV
jgi:hypothetical protein